MFKQLKRRVIWWLTSHLDLTPLRKLYIAYSRASSWLRYGDSKFPRIISIEVCGHCNRSCSYCPNVIYPQKAKLIDDKVLTKVIERLGEIKWNGVVDFIFFNEPTLHPKLADIVRRVKAAAPYSIPRISTNGDLLTTEKVKALLDAGLDRIYAMRHNPTAPGWLERMTALKEQFPGAIILMDIDQLESTTGLHDFNGLVEVKKHRSRDYVKGTARCQIHRHVAQITMDGNWNLCCVDYNKTYAFGSLLERPIMDIWKDPTFVRMRANLEAGIPQTKTCVNCTCLVERTPDNGRPDFVPRASVQV